VVTILVPFVKKHFICHIYVSGWIGVIFKLFQLCSAQNSETWCYFEAVYFSSKLIDKGCNHVVDHYYFGSFGMHIVDNSAAFPYVFSIVLQ